MPDVGLVRRGMQEESLQRALDRVPPDQRAAIASAANAGQIVYKRDPYYSRARINFTVAVNGATVNYTYSKGSKVTFFGYGQNDVLLSAGFPAGLTPSYDQATYADTNLLHGSETNGAETVLCTGIQLYLSPMADPGLVRQVMPELFLSGGVDGQPTQMKWGLPFFWPSGGGFFGAGLDNIDTPPINRSNQQVGFIDNGIPGAEDYSKAIDPFIWGPKGGADSTFVAQLEAQRDVSFTATTRTAVGASGIAGFTPPATANTAFIDLWLRLAGGQFAPRGKNR
jgi:hypothetical protein